jgi:hypothetical protein
MSVIKLVVVIIFSAYAGSVAGGAQFADPVDTGSVAQHLVNDRGTGDAIRDQLEEAIHSGSTHRPEAFNVQTLRPVTGTRSSSTDISRRSFPGKRRHGGAAGIT